ncbi:MAG: CopG family transcriptional regulator [Gammaproteobacteria bacterium]|nr:CopG family transcriptional regulator [Gammaproteobacteria bacterium]
MKNVTITLDEATARWARRMAARHNQSLSRFIGAVLSGKMHDDRRYELAMREYLSLRPRSLGAPGQRYATRDELHDRAGLR